MAGSSPPVSSNVKSVGYDEPTNVLHVEFHGGGVYQYSDVPPGVWRELMASNSKGQFLNSQIKNAYPFRKL